jgi:hypothetical protein
MIDRESDGNQRVQQDLRDQKSQAQPTWLESAVIFSARKGFRG